MFKLLYHPRTAKFTRQLPREQKEKIIEKIKGLAVSPFSPAAGVKKLANTKNSYRLRVGDIRIIFEINKKEKIIYIQDIGFRGGIYRSAA